MISDTDLNELLGIGLPMPEVKKDWTHQAKEFKFGRDKRARALFWSMRTGKSKAVIDKFSYQFGRGTIEGAVLLAPNGVHLNWVLNEIPKWQWAENGPHMAFGWETPKRGDFDFQDAFARFLRHGGMKWFCINMEALSHPDCIKAIAQFRVATNRKIALAISEAHHFGHAGAKRTRLARNLAKIAKYVTLETGTPILNSPLRAYSLFKIISEGWSQYPTYEKFVQHFCEFETENRTGGRRRAFKKVKGYKNLDELRDLMAPWTSVVLREDVGDMPPLIRTERLIVMSDQQRQFYLEMVSRHLVEIGDDMVTAKDGGARMMKLQQCLNSKNIFQIYILILNTASESTLHVTDILLDNFL